MSCSRRYAMLRYGSILLTALLTIPAIQVGFASSPENRKFWYDPADRADFIRELKAQGIPFRVDQEGGVWYPASNVEKIDEISNAIVRKNDFDGTSFTDSEDEAVFKRRLEAASVPYQVRDHLGQRWVTWEKKYDKKAKAIREQIDAESLGRLQERTAGKSRPLQPMQ
jgi:hypothetical protein